MRMITSRLAVIAMLMLAMALVLAACGGDDEPTATPTSAPTTDGGTSPNPTPTPGDAMTDDPTPTPATGGGTGPTGPAATPTPTLTANEMILQEGDKYLTYDQDWQSTPQFEALIPLAQAEGRVHFTAYGQDHVDAVCPAFTARFGIECEGRGIGAGQIVSALDTERVAGEAPTDVVYMSMTQMAQYLDKGYGAEIDWASLGADARRAWDAADVDGNALGVANNQYTNFYRTDMFDVEDLPKTVHDWLDPKYKDLACTTNFLFRAGNGFMAFRHDADEMIDVHKRMIEDNGLLDAGSGGACNPFILSGERPLLYMGYGNPPALLESGVIKQFWNTGQGINMFNVAVASNAPRPNAARLFAAWHASKEASQLTWDIVGAGWAGYGNANPGLLAGGEFADVKMVFESVPVARQRGKNADYFAEGVFGAQ